MCFLSDTYLIWHVSDKYRMLYQSDTHLIWYAPDMHLIRHRLSGFAPHGRISPSDPGYPRVIPDIPE